MKEKTQTCVDDVDLDEQDIQEISPSGDMFRLMEKFVGVNWSLTVISDDSKQSVTFEPEEIQLLILWMVKRKLLVVHSCDEEGEPVRIYKGPEEINMHLIGGDMILTVEGGSEI